MEQKRELTLEEMNLIAGGTDSSDRKKEFDTAWKGLNMDSRGYSGSRKAELLTNGN